MTPRLILAVILSSCPLAAQSTKEKLAELQAQHARDVATINRLIAERAAVGSTEKAITKLGTEGKARGAAAIKAGNVHAEAAQEAVEQVKSAAESVQVTADAVSATAEATKVEVERLRAALPINSVAVWLAAIAGVVTIIGTIGTIVIAHINKTVNTIHNLTNSTLSEMTSKLQIALEKISGLEKQVTIQAEAATRQAALVEITAKTILPA